MSQLIDLRNPGILQTLRSIRIAVVAPVFDPSWKGKKDHVNRAYRVKDKREIAVPDVSLLYLPEYYKDWVDHQAAHRALEVLLFRAKTPRGPVAVDWMQLNALFFFIPNRRVEKMLQGKETEKHLLLDLEKSFSS